MKKIFTFVFLITLFLVTFLYRQEIVVFLIERFSNVEHEVTEDNKNVYFRDYNLSYVKTTDNYRVKNKEDIMNLYYTVINSGIDEFTFYCSKEYSTCMDDVLYIANNQSILSNINSYIHPFNSFTSIKTEYDSLRRITLKVTRTYSNNEIKEMNKIIDNIVDKELGDETDKHKTIKKIHDYIINNTKYDKDRADNNIIKYKSNTAYGVFIEGYGLCGGYTDAMAIFLDMYSIPNFKVISENHIWNAVYIDDAWYHLDLTWDDPVLTDGKDTLEYTFFLISTEELEKLETTQHVFDKNIFKELTT